VILPTFGPNTYSNPPAGLNFAVGGSLLVSERTIGTAHQARLLEYTGGTGTWAPQPVNKFLTGAGGTSATGAGDSDCDGNIWSAGDGIQIGPPDLYGMMRIPGTGNNPGGNGVCYLIDSDLNLTNQDKQQIGTLVHRRVCVEPCANFRDERLVPEIGPDGAPTGCWTYTFRIHNKSAQTVQYMLIPDTNITPNVIFFNPPLLPNTTSSPVQLTLCNVQPGTVSIPFILMNIDNDVCCETDHDVEIPDCFAQPVQATAQCSTSGCNLSVTIQPLNFPVGHVFATYIGTGTVTVSPSYVPVAIPQYGTQKVNFGFTGAQPGDNLCFRIFIHTPDLRECCDEVVCVTVVPPCPDCPIGGGNCDIDFNNDGLFPDTLDVDDMLSVFAGGPCSNDPFCDDIDINNDGLFPDTQDIDYFLSVFSGGPC
jgi:hypothetical protein